MTTENALATTPNTVLANVTADTLKPFITTFQQGNRTVSDLNADGIGELAHSAGIGIEDVEIAADTAEYVDVKAWSVNHASGRREPSLVREYKSNPNDKIAISRAITRAKRNALKAQLPMQAIRERIEEVTGTQAAADDANGFDGGERAPKLASDKQRWKMDQLGIQYPEEITSSEAWHAINDAKQEEGEEEEWGN